MKNFTNNFKQFTSRLSARWLIMALMLLAGTSSVWGKIIYLDVDNWWANDGAWFDAWVWGSSQTDNWYTAVKPNGETYYQIEVPDDATGMKILRKDPSSKEHNWNEWNNSGDLTISNDKNLYKTSGSWSTNKPSSNGKVVASSASVTTGVNVTLTPSLTSNTTYNEIKSTTYSISPTSGASISGNTFTATAAGTYTVTATITYNPKGYSSLTSTVKPTTTITVTNPVTVTSYQLAGFNDWSNPITMTKDGNIYTCAKALTAKEYAVNSEDGFKIIENYSDNNKIWYGNNGTMERDNCSDWTMAVDKNNCGITADVAGTYTFTFDATTKKLTVTYPPECTTTTFSWTTAPVNMNYGETKNIVATLNPDEAGTVSYTASPAGIVTINNNTYTAVGKGDVTITATASLNGGYCPVSDLTKSIKVTCPTPEQPQLSIDQGITDDCGNVTNGIIAIDNYASFEDCTFTLNGNQVTPTNTGKIEGVTTSGSCTVVVTNNCGNSSEPVSIDMTETTIKAPRTDFTVSLSYPQVAFAANNGSVYIDLSGSERNVTYYLFKNDVKVLESEKLGEGEALRWTVLESGTYTVKADNPCNGEIAMTGQVDFTCMSNLNIAFADDKTTFCPGEETNITITFAGTGKGNETTNAGKFGWQWGGSNYSYESIYLNESGVTMPVTINANGSIQLNVKTCNGTLSSNLNFTVVTAPEEPLLDRYAKEICTGETAEITISPYDNACTYKLYKDVNEVETPEFNAGVFTVSEAGSYTIKAVEQECNIESTPSDPFNLTVNGTTITQSPEVVHPYEVVTFTAGEQAKWALYTNPSSGSQLSDDDAKYSGKDTAYITKGESTTTKFKGEAANGYVIHATVGDCTASYTFNVVEDPDNCQ